MSNLLGLLFVLAFLGLIIVFTLLGRRWPRLRLRDLPAFSRLARAIGLAVEDGSRLHMSLGSGGITGTESGVAFLALSMLRRITAITSESDIPPLASAGEGALAILTQDTLQGVSEPAVAGPENVAANAVLTGLTPFSYAAGAMPLAGDATVSSNVLAGRFGSEAALIADAGERGGSFSLAGTDDITGQAVLFATAQESLIGEELFAGGAYLQAGATHKASLHAQDVLRVLIAIVILAGGILKLLGLLP